MEVRHLRCRDSMNRRELLLSILAAGQGRPYTPVQIQRATFLITKNVAGIITEGPPFCFVPYDYEPFDRDVYIEAANLSMVGDGLVAQSPQGR